MLASIYGQFYQSMTSQKIKNCRNGKCMSYRSWCELKRGVVMLQWNMVVLPGKNCSKTTSTSEWKFCLSIVLLLNFNLKFCLYHCVPLCSLVLYNLAITGPSLKVYLSPGPVLALGLGFLQFDSPNAGAALP
jgi:hypothetical protein